MDPMRLGRTLRALRHRLGWRQVDVAERAGVSQDLVSLAELGRIGRLQIDTLRRLVEAVGGELFIGIRWRAGDLDRLLDEGHAFLVGVAIRLLEGLGWLVRVEVTFAIYADRGSIDVLAWHAPTGTLLVVEVKTDLTSVEETLRRHDTKVRHAARVGAEQFRWKAQVVARLLVLPDDSTARRRVRRL